MRQEAHKWLVTPASTSWHFHMYEYSARAALYGVPTKALNQTVKRNAERFPEDFMFRLTRTETDALHPR
jgi:ORF6N domain